MLKKLLKPLPIDKIRDTLPLKSNKRLTKIMPRLPFVLLRNRPKHLRTREMQSLLPQLRLRTLQHK